MNVLILGVGNAQVDAIRYCKSQGFCVHGISYRPEGRGIEWLDGFEVIDIKDKKAVCRYVLNHDISLVYSVGSDVAMPTVSHVSQKLGLPCLVNEATLNMMHNKGRIREFFAQHGISPVPFMTGNRVDAFLEWSQYPSFMKPSDSQGQRGVFEVRNWDEIQRYFARSQSFSSNGTVIIEKRLDGQEISCNAFVHKGRVIYHFLSDRETVPDYPGGIISAHHVPCHLSVEEERRTVDLVKQAIHSLGIREGPVYFQMKHNPATGDIAIIEMIARLDGCHLWRLLRLKYGVDLLDLTFQALLGRIQRLPKPSIMSTKDLRLEFSHQKTNTSFVEIPHDEECLHEEFYYRPGEYVRPVNTHWETVGYRIREAQKTVSPG